MAYNLDWGTNHPGHIVYLLDLSYSMKGERVKELLDILLRVSSNLIAMNKEGRELKDRFTISVIGYNSKVFTIFEGNVSELKEKRDAALRNKTPMFDLNPEWQTYTALGLRAAAKDIKDWIAKQTNAGKLTPAPVVIHITDGKPCETERSSEAAMLDAKAAADELKSISVPDGNTLLFNIHIEPGKPAQRFLSTPPADTHLQFLYEISSELDATFVSRAKSALFELKSEGVDLDSIEIGSRFMVSNETNKDILVRLIVFGSSVSAVGNVYEPAMPK